MCLNISKQVDVNVFYSQFKYTAFGFNSTD